VVRINEQVARGFSLLRSEEFKPLVEFLKARRSDTLESLSVESNEGMKSRLQGRSLELKEIIEFIEDANNLLAKTRRP
jgi:hypothetical protein